MDTWGGGPWFESGEDDDLDLSDAGGQADAEDSDADQPTVQRRVMGAPRPTLPPLPGAVSRPLARQTGRPGAGLWESETGLAGAGAAASDLDGAPTEHARAVPGPGESGSTRRPASPSRPLLPGGFLNGNGRTENWLGDDGDAFGGFGLDASAPATPARPLVPPILDPASAAALTAAMPPVATMMAPAEVDRPLRAGATPGRTPPGHGKRGKRGDDGRRRRLMPLLVALGLVILLVVCSAIGLLESGLLSSGKAHNAGGGSVLAQQPSATSGSTATASSTTTSTSGPTTTPKPKAPSGGPAPAPTPIPPPTAATLSFSPASQQISSPAQMTSCPSGCDLAGQTVSSSQGFTSQPTPASLEPQSELFGTITATNTSTTTTWTVQNFQFTGGGYACAAQPASLLPGGTNSFGCFIPLTSPSIIPKGTIQGAVSIPGGMVNYSQPDDLVGNAHYEVLPQDCTAALNTVHNQGTSWAQGWFSGQTLMTGFQWAPTQPAINNTGDNCPVGNQSPNPFNFTASTTTNTQASAYNPAAAQQLAASRLGTAPAGYQWQSGSPTTCSPTVSGVDRNGTVTLSCSDAGTAVYIWGGAQRSQLASDVAGQTKIQALAICNGRTGVKSGSCAVAIQGGDGSVLPANAGAVTVTVGAP